MCLLPAAEGLPAVDGPGQDVAVVDEPALGLRRRDSAGARVAGCGLAGQPGVARGMPCLQMQSAGATQRCRCSRGGGPPCQALPADLRMVHRLQMLEARSAPNAALCACHPPGGGRWRPSSCCSSCRQRPAKSGSSRPAPAQLAPPVQPRQPAAPRRPPLALPRPTPCCCPSSTAAAFVPRCARPSVQQGWSGRVGATPGAAPLATRHSTPPPLAPHPGLHCLLRIRWHLHRCPAPPLSPLIRVRADAGRLVLRLESGSAAATAATWPSALLVVAGWEPYELVARGVAAAVRLSGGMFIKGEGVARGRDRRLGRGGAGVCWGLGRCSAPHAMVVCAPRCTFGRQTATPRCRTLPPLSPQASAGPGWRRLCLLRWTCLAGG